MTIRTSKGEIRVLLYSYYTTITGWGVLLVHEFGILDPEGRGSRSEAGVQFLGVTVKVRFAVWGLGFRVQAFRV